MSEKIKVCIWEEFPRRYPHYFYEKVRSDGRVKLLVNYYGGTYYRPRQLTTVESLLPGDKFVKPDLSSLYSIDDWGDYIHIVSGARNSFLRKLIFEFIKRDVKWVNRTECVHMNYKWPIKYVFWWLYGYYINKYALGAFGVSAGALRQFEKFGVSNKKIHLLPYSFKLLETNAREDAEIKEFSKSRKVFMHFGELSKGKATDILISAFAKLGDCNWVLVLVGRDTGEINIEKSINDNNLEKSVLVRGAVEYENIANIMNHCDVFVLPSRFDGWGAVLNEMASLKKPLISTSSCGAAEHLIVDGVNGYIVSANDAVALSDAMKNYIDDKALINLHGEKSFDILKEYSVEMNLERMHAGLSKMICLKEKDSKDKSTEYEFRDTHDI